MIVIMVVKASLTLGREEKPCMKGLVGLYIEVKIFSSWRGFFCSWSMGSIEPICLVCCYGRYKCIDVMRRVYFDSLEDAFVLWEV